MSNRLFAPPAGKTFSHASPEPREVDRVDGNVAIPAPVAFGLLGDSDWTSTTVSARVLAASVDFEMEAGRAVEWFEALVPRFKRALHVPNPHAAAVASGVVREVTLPLKGGAHADASGAEVTLPAMLIKGAASVHAFHAYGRKDSIRFSIVVTDAYPNSLAFVDSSGNWLRMGGVDADSGVAASAAGACDVGTASTLRETRLIISMFEYGGLILAQGLCEALCVQGQMPSVIMVGAPAAMAHADRIQLAVTSMMAAMCDTPADTCLPPAVTVPTQESAVCVDPAMTPIDPETDMKMRQENMQVHAVVRRLPVDAPVSHALLAFVWFARINMSGAALMALLDFLSAAWVPPPDAFAAPLITVPVPPACTVKARGASTEATIISICKWVAAAPPRWRSRFISQLKTYTELVTNKWK
jgi:hypothetical protein